MIGYRRKRRSAEPGYGYGGYGGYGHGGHGGYGHGGYGYHG